MRKSINLYFCKNDTKEKLDAIKAAGYEEFFTGINDVGETMTMTEQLEYASSIGLQCTMIHCKYGLDASFFWLNDEKGDVVVNDYLNQIEVCAKYCKYFVVHLTGFYITQIFPIGLERLKKLLDRCKELGVYLCVENLELADEISYIFDNIDHSNLMMCYDIGHKYCATFNSDYVSRFGKFIKVLHIHDNDCKYDLHKIPFQADINWEEVAKELASLPSDIVLSSEIKGSVNYEKTLQENLTALNKLEEMIKKYRSI